MKPEIKAKLGKVTEWMKSEIVLCVAAMLALFSMCLVPPNRFYVKYLDYRTLVLLFCLMAVVAGLKRAGVFEWLSGQLLGKISNARQLTQVLVFLCFFTSMFITNDVALLTFVPFTLLVVQKAGCKQWTIYIIVLQTIAANLGSMLLPVGNPQNLYLYGISGYTLFQFVGHMCPLWICSFVGLWFCTLVVKKKEISVNTKAVTINNGLFYLVLFLFCLGTVAELLPYWVLFPILVLAIFWKEKEILLEVDYCLLITFICFFIFIGNVKAMPQVANLLQKLIVGREFFVGIVSSQLISNVPAAILLSGFSHNTASLLWATNIGGLGTLIASLASVISYKIYMQEEEKNGKKYFKVFTGVNLIFLAALCGIGVLMVNVHR